MIGAYEKMFGNKPHEYSFPLDRRDHPELDDSEELGDEDTTKYQSMIGVLQWLISLGHFDIASAVMTMTRFRANPRVGHLERLKHIYGYIRKLPNGCIHVRTATYDYSDIPKQEYDWEQSVYGPVKELVPDDTPEPLGKEVVTTTYVGANLYHYMLTGRAVTGVLHLLNGTPVEWYSKRQATVETATYGS